MEKQILKKLKINCRIVFSIFLLTVLLIVGTWFIRSNQTNQVIITGVIRTDGLSEKEKQKFGLINVNYQITDFGDYQKAYEEKQIMGYYLLSSLVDDKWLGKCVRVVGNIPEEWKNKDMNDSYQRLALNITNVEKINNSTCNPYPQTPLINNNQEKLIFEGTIVYGKRPSPDTGYDYQLKLVKPFIDQNSPVGRPQEISLIDVIPSTNNIWSKLESNINKKISVEGYMVWGYSESKYLETISVKTE